MKEFYSQPTKTQPSIRFQNGILDIEGRSVPNYCKQYFEPLIEVLNIYLTQPKDVTEINIKLDLVNSETNRAIMTILMIAEKLHLLGKTVVIKWFYSYNDTFMFEQGTIFESLIEAPFQYEEIKECAE